jgi:hypothetical protein
MKFIEINRCKTAIDIKLFGRIMIAFGWYAMWEPTLFSLRILEFSNIEIAILDITIFKFSFGIAWDR